MRYLAFCVRRGRDGLGPARARSACAAMKCWRTAPRRLHATSRRSSTSRSGVVQRCADREGEGRDAGGRRARRASAGAADDALRRRLRVRRAGPARVSFLDLFEGRRSWCSTTSGSRRTASRAAACTMFTDQVAALAHLHARDVTLRAASRRASQDRIAAYKAADGLGRSRGTRTTSRSRSPAARRSTSGSRSSCATATTPTSPTRPRAAGVEALGTVWTFLDRTPYGRQEEWEDTPRGRPQGAAVPVVAQARRVLELRAQEQRACRAPWARVEAEARVEPDRARVDLVDVELDALAAALAGAVDRGLGERLAQTGAARGVAT